MIETKSAREDEEQRKSWKLAKPSQGVIIRRSITLSFWFDSAIIAETENEPLVFTSLILAFLIISLDESSQFLTETIYRMLIFFFRD